MRAVVEAHAEDLAWFSDHGEEGCIVRSDPCPGLEVGGEQRVQRSRRVDLSRAVEWYQPSFLQAREARSASRVNRCDMHGCLLVWWGRSSARRANFGCLVRNDGTSG